MNKKIIKVDFTKLSDKRYRTMVCRNKKRREWLIHLKDCNLRRHYGITLKEYELLLKRQKGFCAICRGRQTNRQNRSLDVDHEKEYRKD